MLCASLPVNSFSISGLVFTRRTGAAASRSDANAQSHQTKVASYCEISFFALKVFQVSMRIGRTMFRAGNLNRNLDLVSTKVI